ISKFSLLPERARALKHALSASIVCRPRGASLPGHGFPVWRRATDFRKRCRKASPGEGPRAASFAHRGDLGFEQAPVVALGDSGPQGLDLVVEHLLGFRPGEPGLLQPLWTLGLETRQGVAEGAELRAAVERRPRSLQRPPFGSGAAEPVEEERLPTQGLS